MFIHTKKTRLEVVVDMRNEYTWKGWVFLPLVVENFYTLCAVDCWQVCWLVVISIDIRLGQWNCGVESHAKNSNCTYLPQYVIFSDAVSSYIISTL